MNANQQQPQQLSQRGQIIMAEALKNLRECNANPGAFEAAQAADSQAWAATHQFPYAPSPLPALNPDGGLADDRQHYSATSFDESKVHRDGEGKFSDGDAPVRQGHRYSQQCNSPDFRQWFSGSRVTNADGTPKVVYHGTRSAFDRFKPGNAEGGAIFFSGSSQQAGKWAMPFAGAVGGSIRPSFLKMLRPLKVDAKGRLYEPEWMEKLASRAKSGGHDGIIIRNVTNFEGGPESTSFAVFDPAQIRSAISGDQPHGRCENVK